MGARAVVVTAMRRAGLVPGGQADLVGEDATVIDEALDHRVMVFFPDPPENYYQLHQWIEPLRALDREHRVLVVCQDSRTAAALRKDSPLDCRVIARNRTLETVVRDSNFGLCLYVGQANANAVALRLNRLAHVFLSHGESDKLVTVSNLEKSFDQVFVAGEAAVDRHRRSLMFFEPDRLIQVGRPQARSFSPPAADAPVTILYAPTWEGSQEINEYSSLKTHATAILESAVATNTHTIFRPHPRTGRSDRTYRDTLASIIEYTARHSDLIEYDTSDDPTDSMARSHILISDVSAMAVDWLATVRPLMVTRPTAPKATVVNSRLLATVPRLDIDDASQATSIATALLGDDSAIADVAELRSYYLGASSGNPRAFVKACGDILARRDGAWASIQNEGGAA